MNKTDKISLVEIKQEPTFYDDLKELMKKHEARVTSDPHANLHFTYIDQNIGADINVYMNDLIEGAE